MTKVLITGAAGVLGRAFVSLLEREKGFELRLTDALPLDTPHELVQADLAHWDQARSLCDGIDEVLHIAAIHPWKPYTPEQYLDCNVKGTWNLLQAAAEAHVRRVIYTSSIAAMGYGYDDPRELPFDESKPCRPVEDLYGVTKHVGEQFCELFRARGELAYLALRPGTFIPRDTDDSGFGLGLLTQWLHPADIAQAHVLALKSDVANEAIVITSKVPFTHADGPALLEDARSVILNYYPRAKELEERGIELPASIPRCYSIAKAERLLGYQPEWTFATWLERILAQ